MDCALLNMISRILSLVSKSIGDDVEVRANIRSITELKK
jgi:hypothetical protein